MRATNFVGASTAATVADADSDADGSAEALGSADCEIDGAGPAASSLSVPADFDQTIATNTAIPITTNHAVRLEVDCFGAAPGFGAAGAATTGFATTAAGADVTATAVDGLTGYNVEIRANGKGDWTVIATVPADQLTQNVTKASDSGWTQFRVSSVYSDGQTASATAFGIPGEFK